MKFTGWEATTRGSNNVYGNSGGSGGSGSGIFLKLKVGERAHVRLISQPYEYFQHWDPFPARSPGVDPETKKVLDPLLIADPTLKPKKRYAIWVLDRNDNNKLKIMDFSGPIYDEFVKWKKTFNDEPGGPKGPNWYIEGTCVSGKKKDTRWTAAYLERAPLTTEEIAAIQAGDLQNVMIQHRRPNTPDEIREMMAKHGMAGGVPKQASSAPAAQQPARQAPPAQTQAPAQPRPSAPPAADAADNIEF